MGTRKEDKKVSRRDRKKSEAEAKAKKKLERDARLQKKEDDLTKLRGGEPSSVTPSSAITTEQAQANAFSKQIAIDKSKDAVNPLGDSTRGQGGLGKKIQEGASRSLDSLRGAFSNMDMSFDASNISDAFLEAPEKLSRSDLFPALNQPIHVGNAGGSEIGNIPIFVGGGDIFPVEIINARVRAMAKGSAKTRAENKKLEQAFEHLDTADQFEGALNGQLIDLTEEFRGKYRNNWRKASKDPEFRKRYADLKAKAGGLTALSAKAEEVLKASKNGNFYVSKEAREAAMSTAEGINNFEETSAEDVLKNQQVMNIWESSIAGATRIAAKVGSEFKTEFEQFDFDKQKTVLGILSSMKVGDYSGIAKLTTLAPSLASAKLLANADFDGGRLGKGQVKRDDYVKLVLSMLNTKETGTMTNIVSKSEQAILNEKSGAEVTRAEAALTNANAAFKKAKTGETNASFTRAVKVAEYKAAGIDIRDALGLEAGEEIDPESIIITNNNPVDSKGEQDIEFIDDDWLVTGTDDVYKVKVSNQSYHEPRTLKTQGNIQAIAVSGDDIDIEELGRMGTVNVKDKGLTDIGILTMRVANEDRVIQNISYKKGDAITGAAQWWDEEITKDNMNMFTEPKNFKVLVGSDSSDRYLMPVEGSAETFTADQEEGIQAAMTATNASRNQVIAALKKKGKL